MKYPVWLGISALILSGNAIAKTPYKNHSYSQPVQITHDTTTNSTQIETEIRQFINAMVTGLSFTKISGIPLMNKWQSLSIQEEKKTRETSKNYEQN